MAAGLPVPKQIWAHGWLLMDSAKMSKSLGNVVKPRPIVNVLGLDALRYYLLRETVFGQDGNFSYDSLVQRYNSDLANGYGNLVSRTLAMITKYFDGQIPYLDTEGTQSDVIAAAPPIGAMFDEYDFHSALSYLWALIGKTDGYISEKAPWKLASSDHPNARKDLALVLYQAAEDIRALTALLHPVMPYATAKVWAQLGLGSIEEAARKGELKNLAWGGLKPGTKLGLLSPIFPRAPKELIQLMTDMENPTVPTPSKLVDEKTTHTTPAPEDPTHPGAAPRTSTLAEANPGATVAGSASPTTERPATPPHTEAAASGIFAAEAKPDTPQIAIDDFVKIDLRVAKILVAERIPKADKLLRLEVDLGYETRQILSGIAEWYTPEELIGRRIVVIANLAPRKMRGLESHGMLLAASNGESGKPILATFADSEDIELGSRLK
jgi:methionyl-tRNA synthetase